MERNRQIVRRVSPLFFVTVVVLWLLTLPLQESVFAPDGRATGFLGVAIAHAETGDLSSSPPPWPEPDDPTQPHP
ncbi:MAG: hypothetical protein ABIK65_08780 [Candidatus Eisenbacteria bacterium]